MGLPPVRLPPLPSATDEHSVFRTLFVAYPDALVVADARGAIVLANPASAELLGYSVDELVTLNVDALVPDAIRPRHAAYRGAYAHCPQPLPMGSEMELVARRRDGSVVMVEISLSPLQDHGLPLVVAAIRGIGAYPRVKQALQRARYGEHLAQLGRLAVDSRDPQALLDEVPAIATQALQVDQALVFLLEADRLHFRVASAVGALQSEALGSFSRQSTADTPGLRPGRGASGDRGGLSTRASVRGSPALCRGRAGQRSGRALDGPGQGHRHAHGKLVRS